MGISTLRRAYDGERPVVARKPDYVRREEHERIVQELTHKYELQLLALRQDAPEALPEAEQKRKPGRPRKA